MEWQLTCRVCLESGDMVSLFDWDDNKEQLSEKYTFCCGIAVTPSDCLPTLICLTCVDNLSLAYNFKQQCISSNETLKECIEEFMKTSSAVDSKSKVTEKETFIIKQDNGTLLQYELPIEFDPDGHWSRTTVANTPGEAVVTKEHEPRKRGRPRKYPKEQEQIGFSGDADDTDFNFEEEYLEEEKPVVKKRGRKRRLPPKADVKEDNGVDVLLKETIMAFSEPIPDHILNPKPRKKYPYKKQKRNYKHICETCGSTFASTTLLQAHIRRHMGIKPFVCSVCSFATVSRLGLRRHMIRHTGVKPHKCQYCERDFYAKSDRLRHERLHTGVRPYQCSVCGKWFRLSIVLRDHMFTHTGEKKYSCAVCDRKFTKSHHLKYHMKCHHKELYIQQQAEKEAKKARQVTNVTTLFGVVSGQIVDGQLHLTQTGSEDGRSVKCKK